MARGASESEAHSTAHAILDDVLLCQTHVVQDRLALLGDFQIREIREALETVLRVVRAAEERAPL